MAEEKNIVQRAKEELKKDNITVSVVYPYITLTDFEKNTLKEIQNGPQDFGALPHPPDNPELVAEKIIKAIKSGEPEIFAHGWMKTW